MIHILRHPGLEPGSRFFGAGQGSETPGQARGDGLGLGRMTKPIPRHSREGGNPASGAPPMAHKGSETPGRARGDGCGGDRSVR